MGFNFSKFSKLGSGAKPPLPKPHPLSGWGKQIFITHPLILGWLRHWVWWSYIEYIYIIALPSWRQVWGRGRVTGTPVTYCLPYRKTLLQYHTSQSIQKWSGKKFKADTKRNDVLVYLKLLGLLFNIVCWITECHFICFFSWGTQ